MSAPSDGARADASKARAVRGGYPSSGRLVTDLPSPTSGPAPGASVIAAAKAEALREAAKALPGFDSIRTHGDAADWLRDRADSIEQGSGR